MASAQFKILGEGELTKLINNVKKSGVHFDALVQRAAVQCVAQSILHRNITPGNALYNALPKGSRRDSLVAWLEKFGNFAWMKDEKKLAFYEALKPEAWTPEYAIITSKTMWTTGTRPPVIKSAYDMEEEFSKFLDRMSKHVNDKNKEVKHADLFDKMKAAYTAYIVENDYPVEEEEEEEEEAIAA